MSPRHCSECRQQCKLHLEILHILSHISVMTEITVKSGMPAAIERFVLHWGEMGAVWGVNRSVAQIHALLFLAERPLSAEDIAEQLGLARSNVSNSLRELLSWSLIRRVPQFGDRRDFFEAEADMFEMVRRIARGRKERELDPTLLVLQHCVDAAQGDRNVSATARKRMAAMLEFMTVVDRSFDEIMRLPSATVMALLRMGGAIARFVGAGSKPARKRQP